MRETSFYWHDYETWGTNPRWDRPCQFAGIRTDTDLNIIGEPLSLYCRPPVDRLPQPMACLVTGISPQRAQAEGLSEADFFARIHAELAAPGTCGVGYNSLRFDDEVTRYGLYRNFYDPYGREWRNGNGRWDIIDLLRLTRALRPEGINWPVRDDGAPSFRLEQLTAANGIEHAAAHDALSDVRASIAMARLVRQRQPRVYEYVLEHKDKQRVAKLLDLQEMPPVLHVSGMFPAERGSLAVVMPLLAHPTDNNGIVVYDLHYDPRPWLEMDQDAIRQRLYTATADLAEGEERIALKTVHLNRCPVLAGLNTLTDSARREWSIDLERCARHRDLLLEGLPRLGPKLAQVFARQPFTPDPDPEQALYQGFISDADRRLCERVLRMTPEELAKARLGFAAPRLPELLFRYRARNWPGTLNQEERERWQRHRRQALIGGEPTPEAYAAEIERLRLEYPDRLALLDELACWPAALGVENG